MRLTDAKVKAVPRPQKRKIIWDESCAGLGLRVSPEGGKSFVVMYRYQGKARMMTIGQYPKVSLADAREVATKARNAVIKGIDPGQKAVEGRQAERNAITVAGLCAEYIERHAKRHKKTWREDQRTIEADILPILGDHKAKDIRKRDIKLVLDKIVARGAGVQANRTKALLGKIFSFAVEQDILDASPCIGIKNPTKEKPRDRVLTEGEIEKLWHGLDDADMDEKTKLILKLVLVTAQRKGEVANAKWSEIDLASAWWTIPAERSKNELAHRVPLTGLAMDLLKEARALAGESLYVFPGKKDNRPITACAVSRAVARNTKKLEIEDFGPHDLRRTAASLMTGIGISRLVVSKILNHVERDITAVYDRHSYDNEKRQALEAWERKLEGILSGGDTEGKIITMKRKEGA